MTPHDDCDEPVLLTEQQLRVAILLAKGHTYTQVANQLSLSPHTIPEHVRHIYERLGCSRREQLVLYLVGIDAVKCPPQVMRRNSHRRILDVPKRCR